MSRQQPGRRSKPVPVRAAITSAAVILALAASSLVTSPAFAISPMAWSWSGPVLVDQQAEPDLSSVACPSTELCVAGDSSGHVLTTTNPASSSATWTTAAVDGTRFMTAVACAGSGLCVAGDSEGNLLTSTDPTGGASAWTAPAHVASYIGSVSCPTTSFCAAVSYSGDVLISTDPTSGASAWQATTVDSGHRLSSVSCASTSFCVAVDQSGDELTSTNPTGGTGAWSAPQEIAARANETPEPLNTVSCPTTSFCAASDGYEYVSYDGYSIGNLVVSANPTGGAGAWTISPAINDGLFGLSCPLAGVCLSVDYSGKVYSVEATGGISWTTSELEASFYGRNFSGIACPSAQLCVAIDTAGNAFTGTAKAEESPSKETPGSTGIGGSTTGGASSPTNSSGGSASIGASAGEFISPSISVAQLSISLKQQLVLPSGKAAQIGMLLKKGGLSLPLKALEAGTITIQWYYLPSGAKLAKQTKPVLVATGRLTFSAAGTRTVKVRLTSAGRRVLRRTRRVSLMAKGTFTPSTGAAGAVSAPQEFVLHGAAVGHASAHASARRTGASVSGLALTGPLSNITLCTKYSYRVQVVSPQSYRGAVISFVVPPSGTRITKTVNLVAHRPWRGSFAVQFATTNNMSTKGIEVGVSVLPPHRGYKTLFSKVYAVTPAAVQPPNPPQFCGGPPPPGFGS